MVPVVLEYENEGGRAGISLESLEEAPLDEASPFGRNFARSGGVAQAVAEGALTREEIAAAKAARIHNFIMALPQGYDTVLQDNGAGISKGQRQLLTIARAMLLDSPMLILDEATSNVDTRTEILIQKAMDKLMRGRTCFVIAHRLSTIVNADRILVINNGDIVEQGTHQELLAQGGFYASLYASQYDKAV